MNSKTILQSDLLDIVFENRNKEYGAYALRKHYEERMSFSLLIMFGLVLILFLFRFSFSGIKDTGQKHSAVIQIHESKVSGFREEAKKISMPVKKKTMGSSKSKSRIETTPRIVDEKLINKTVASVNDPVRSNNIEVEGNENLADGNGIGMNFESTENTIGVVEKKKEIEKKNIACGRNNAAISGWNKSLACLFEKEPQGAGGRHWRRKRDFSEGKICGEL